MNEEMGLVMRQQEEREALRSLIAQWNANRLDLFELSEPNEELEFHGVMRFYFQDSGQKVATKCIRVASDASAHAVIETLIEKFRPDMRMLSLPEYALYEIHENGDERRLGDEEKPLLVQLNWHNDDREGRFLLRRIDDKTNYSQMPEGTFQNASFKRKLSKREKKQLKKQEKLNRLRSTNDENDSGVAEKLYNEKPETSFTRSISNPEAVMRRRRQQKLERKLQLFRSKDGGPDTGGTLKIYGEALCKDVPYKTLLLSIGDTAAMVVKEMLAKYGLDKEDPQHYCLAQVNTAIEESKDNGNNNTMREYILDDDECPLSILMNHPLTRGSIMFHVRRRPADYHPRKRKKKPQGGKWQHSDVIDYNTYQDDRLPFLLELNPDGSEIGGGTAKRYRLQPNVTEVGSERSTALSLQLFGPNVQPRHCVIAHTEGLVTVTPCTRDAETYVNNQRIYETTILQNGCTVKFGRLHTFRFLDPCHEERTRHRHDSARSPHEYSYDRQSMREDASSLSIHGPGETSTPQHDPGQKQQDNTSMNQGPPNYETTFDVEGNVETRSTSSLGNKEDTRSQRSLSSHHSHRLSSYDSRMIRGTEPILPAVLEIREETEEALLHSIITDLEPSCLGFKLAPAYTLYLAARYRASTHYRPELTPTERAHRLTLVMARVANMIHDVIQERYCEVKWLALWLANASELLHFLKSDRHISAFSLDAQDTLADAVQIAFRHLVACLQGELSAVMPNFLSDREDLSHDPEDSSTASVLGVLCNGMSLLRMCKVNAALTIQLFSQLFNYVNVWAFNRIVGPNSIYCSRAWGLRLKARLAQIEVWAERQGLELAADCHLAKIMQAAHLLQAPKYTCDDLANLSSTYFKLNSLQLRALLQKYQPTPDEPRIPHEIIDSVVRVAENLADELALADGREVRLEEDPELALPFLLPEDGYSCEVVKGVPPGLVDFVAPLQASGLARLTVQPSSNGLWTVYMGPVNTMMQRSASAMSNRSGGFAPSQQEPEVQLIKLHKSNNGMGLSIVAAKGAGQDRLGIYIKSVVKGGAADADGRLQAGDQLLKVDGQSLVGITQEKAAEYLVRTGPVVSLEVAKQGAIYHGLATLLSQPSPLISRGGRRLSERDLPSRVLSDQQLQGSQPLQNRAANHLPPAYPPLHSSKSVPSLNSGSKNEVDRGVMNQTVIGTSTIPRQNHESYNPGYSRTSSANSIAHKPFEQYPNHQIRSRSSQNLAEGRGNVPNTLNRGPNIPQYPVGYPPTPTSQAGYPNQGPGYHPSQGYPPTVGGYPPGPGYPPHSAGFQQPGYTPMYHHVHHQANNMTPQAQQSASPDQERFYQNLSVYRNHDQPNGFVPGRAKLPSPHDERSLYQQGPPPSQPQMQLGAQQQRSTNTLRGSQSSLQSGRVNDSAPLTNRDRPASAYLPHNNHHLQHQTMPARSQSSRDMMRQEAKLQEMSEEITRREMRVTSPQHNRHPQMVSSPVGGSPMKYPSVGRDGYPDYSNRVESPPPPPPTSTHPLYHPANTTTLTRPPGPGYNASVGEPPKGGFIPTGVASQRPPHLYQGSNPWEREQKEREAEIRRNKARQWRDHQIVELGSLPQRTPQQEEQLRALSLEREFEKRAEEIDDDEDEDTETNERVQGLLRAAQQNDERRSLRNNIPPHQQNNQHQQFNNNSNQYQHSPGVQQQYSSPNAQQSQPPPQHINGIMRTPTSSYTQVSAEEKARLQRLKELKMKQAEVEAERMKKKEEEQKREVMSGGLGYQNQSGGVNKNSVISGSGTLGRGSSATMGTAHLRLDNLVVNSPSNHYHNNNGYSPQQTSPVKGGENAPDPPERGSSFTVMSQAMRPPTTPSAANTTPSKKVSFQEPSSSSDPPSPNSSTREDPNSFINEAESMLASPTTPDTAYSVTNTPGVIGAQEVYRDPRTKRLAAQEAANKNKVQVPEKLSFKEKMKMFAMETGEDGTPKDKVKISRAQRDIDNIGSPTTPNNNQSAQGNTATSP